MNVLNAAIQVLKEAGKPLHAKEVSERIIEAGLWQTTGKMPAATVSARLYSDIKKSGDDSVFVKVAPQTFALRDIQIVSFSNFSQKLSLIVFLALVSWAMCFSGQDVRVKI